MKIKTTDAIVQAVIQKMDSRSIIEAAKRCLTDEIEEAMINRHKSFNDNISNIDIYDEKEL